METALQALNREQSTLARLVLINMPKGATIEEATNLALREVMNYELILSQRPELAECTPESVVLAVKQCIADNLTLAPNAGLVYLYPGKVLVKVEGSTKHYKTVLMYDPTANGRLSIARQAGAILDSKQATYTFNTDGKLETVSVEFLVPSYPTPRWDKITYGQLTFAKWAAKSTAKFGKANANYTSWNGGIDPEFAATKAIRHALNRRGTNMNERRIAAIGSGTASVTPSAATKEAQDHVQDIQYEELLNSQTVQPEKNNEIPDLI